MGKFLTRIANRLECLLPGAERKGIWCVVANVAEEHPFGPGGDKVKRGTKHFRPGALVYCSPALWGDGYEKIKVIGHHRGSNRYVTMVLQSAWLTNWRVKLVYSPHIIAEFRKMGATWDASIGSKRQAEKIVAAMQKQP